MTYDGKGLSIYVFQQKHKSNTALLFESKARQVDYVDCIMRAYSAGGPPSTGIARNTRSLTNTRTGVPFARPFECLFQKNDRYYQ